MAVVTNKPSWAVRKHTEALAGTCFAKCAVCAGTSGKLEENGTMRCSRAGATPVLITEEQAQQCNGQKPPPVPGELKKSPIFERQETQ